MSEHEPLHPVAGHFTDVFTARKQPPEFIIEDVLPAGLVFLSGPPKVYKSTLTMGLAARVAGYTVTGFPREWKTRVNGPVLCFSYEADAGECRCILEDGMGIKGTEEERILIADDPAMYRLDDPDGVAQMLHWLNARGPALVILDPLANFHQLEEKDAAGMIRILSPLRAWAKANKACFLVVHHTRKQQDGTGTASYKPQDMRGTSALFGLCDGILTLSPARGEYTVSIDAVFKRAPAWNKTFSFGIWSRKGFSGGEQLRQIHQMIMQNIEHDFCTVKKLAEHMAMREDEVKKYVEFLIMQGVVAREGKLLRNLIKVG